MSLSADVVPLSAQAFELVHSLLARIVDEVGMETMEELQGTIQRGARQLWGVAYDGELLAAIVTQVETQNHRKIGTIVYAGGAGVDGLVHAYEVLRGFFQRNQCTAIEVIGRKGWQRVLECKGLKPKAVYYREDL